MVSYNASLLDAMSAVNAREMIKNICTYRTERTLMERKCQLKIKTTSRQDQAASRAHNGNDFIVFTNKGDSLALGTVQCAVPIVSVEA